MIKCPVCGEFEFNEDGGWDTCEVCKWRNNAEQMKDPNLVVEDANGDISLNEAREQWKKNHLLDKGYPSVICPVCGQYRFEQEDDFDVCTVCGWENDGIQMDDPDYVGGANGHISLNMAREQWKKNRKLNKYLVKE